MSNCTNLISLPLETRTGTLRKYPRNTLRRPRKHAVGNSRNTLRNPRKPLWVLLLEPKKKNITPSSPTPLPSQFGPFSKAEKCRFFALLEQLFAVFLESIIITRNILPRYPYSVFSGIPATSFWGSAHDFVKVHEFPGVLETSFRYSQFSRVPEYPKQMVVKAPGTHKFSGKRE